MYKIVLLRHGQTVYNRDKIFCGWTDVDLTEQGINEAIEAGKSLKTAGIKFDSAFCSVLKRSRETLSIVLDEIGQSDIPVNYTWRLNERHYGALQGQKHADVAATCSVEQVQKWRRSFCEKPPQLTEEDPRNPLNDQKYCDIDKADLPCGESLEDTVKRVLVHWNSDVVPQVKSGKTVIVAASGNSLRALVKHIDGISDDGIVGLEIPTGTPLVYELDENLKPINRYYLTKGGVQQPLSRN